MALDINGASRTEILVSDEADETRGASTVTITSGTSWKSKVFSVEHPDGDGGWSLDIELQGDGSSEITIDLRGGNYKRDPLPSLVFSSSDLPTTDAAAITSKSSFVINVGSQYTNWSQVALTASSGDVTLTRAVLKYG